MDHVAIMKGSWKLTEKVLSGEKRIESRWYSTQRAPWNRIKPGDIVYFKDSGEPVGVRAAVGKVLQISDLTPDKVNRILNEYSHIDGLDKNRMPYFFDLFKDKRYCVLVFLKNAARIEPFNINKKGFGVMSAWITIDDVDKIKVAAH